MKAPFCISARLMPALKIGGAWLSLSAYPLAFHLDLPNGDTFDIAEYHPGTAAVTLRTMFTDMLNFMSAAGESRQYRLRTGRNGENEELFEPKMVDWIADNMDEISSLAAELEVA